MYQILNVISLRSGGSLFLPGSVDEDESSYSQLCEAGMGNVHLAFATTLRLQCV